MGTSREHEGGEITEYFDDDGKKIAESRKVGEYTEYVDPSGNKIGESTETENLDGKHTEYVDPSGNKIGEAQELESPLGKYTEYHDAFRRKTGESRRRRDLAGGYTEYTGSGGFVRGRDTTESDRKDEGSRSNTSGIESTYRESSERSGRAGGRRAFIGLAIVGVLLAVVVASTIVSRVQLPASKYPRSVTSRTAAPGLPVAIPNRGRVISRLTYPVSGSIVDVRIRFQFTHACEKDLRAELRHPDGTRVLVMNRGLRRCSGVLTRFTSDNPNLGQFFRGKQTAGVWTLRFIDDNRRVGGRLDSWSLEIRGVQQAPKI